MRHQSEHMDKLCSIEDALHDSPLLRTNIARSFDVCTVS